MSRSRVFVALCTLAGGVLLQVVSPLAAQVAAPAPRATKAAIRLQDARAAGEAAGKRLAEERAAKGAAADSPATAATANAAPSETPRLTRLKTQIYDRRPSVIVRAWAEQSSETATSPASSSSERPEAPTNPEEAATPQKTAENGATPDAATAESAAKAAAAAAELEQELKLLQRHITLGRWSEVKSYLAALPEIEGKEGYAQMLRSLSAPPQPNGGGGRQGQLQEQHTFSLEDVLGLAGSCPHKRERESVQQLSPMLQMAMQSGVLSQSVVARLEQEAARPEAEALLTRGQCAWLLVASGLTIEIEPFLPKFESALESKDSESLILLSRCRLAQYDRERKPESLETAWNILQRVLSLDGGSGPLRDEALRLVVSLIPKVRSELGQGWLDSTFTAEPTLGMKILGTTGTAAAEGLQQHMQNPAERLRELQVQRTIVHSLLEKNPERAGEWQNLLRVLALAWLREAELSRNLDRSTSMGPRMQRDMYGNLFYFNDDEQMMMQMQRSNNEIRPISSADVLESAPGDPWLARLDTNLRPKFEALQAQLYLKVSEDEKAYPYIERLAATHPTLARDLVHEFIRVWTRNHDPNASRRYTSPYMYIYGFEMRANGIPLTRSKQERNLEELSGWLQRIRKLPLKDLDESLFAKAFTTCHSSAEVYRIDSIERVFGGLDGLDAKTLAQLVQQMRSNLAGIWRMPAQQEQQKTQRKQKDIQAEVIRGYAVAGEVVTKGLGKYPNDWRLILAEACLLLDENAYRNEIAPSSTFSEERLVSLEKFRRAAELYAKQVPALPEAEQEVTAYEHWFYAGLGASDLGQIDHRSSSDPKQPGLIREAILALPGEAAEKHLGMFANSLFTRMSSLKPTVKFPYLKAGFEIVGDHKQAREAQRVYDYYKDLVTEIKLVSRLDGSPRVSHGAPFGAFIELNHTVEIERESGGFQKYLQNQNSMSFSWNYGRPLENYRDKFEEAVRNALDEHFEVLSFTFQEKDVHSRAADYGWRTTPYAYVLLKARGPEVDKLPALKMDLDFLDTSGYAVLPITSPALPINAADDQQEPRPYRKLEVTQTLDERQAKEGKLVLEVKATARGLVPPLEEILDARTSDFEVTSTEDQGVLVSRFDPESSAPAVITERTWMISYAGRQDLAELPKTFQFPEPRIEEATVAYMRYEDSDLKSVESTVSLEQKYGEVRRIWPWVLAALIPAAIACGLGWRAWSKSRRVVLAPELALPGQLTPFNVLALLRRVEANNGFTPNVKQELVESIDSIERHYFAGSNGQAPDLRQVAEQWLKRAK